MSRDYDEKRNFIRMAIDCPVELTVEEGGTRLGGVAHNLSGGGLLIESEQPVAAGALLRVRLIPGRQVVPPFEARVEVVRSDPLPGGGSRLGVSIVEIVR